MQKIVNTLKKRFLRSISADSGQSLRRFLPKPEAFVKDKNHKNGNCLKK
jgi:hypothetical protein